MAEGKMRIADLPLEATNLVPRHASSKKKAIENLEVDMDSFLGKGASASVYRGTYEYRNQQGNRPKKIPVAVKVIEKSFVAGIHNFQ
jgi:hypothetical protein